MAGRSTPGTMGSRKNLLVALVTILLHVFLLPSGFAGRQGAEGLLLGFQDLPSDLSPPGSDAAAAEQIWVSCSLDLMDFDGFSLLKDITQNSNEISRRTRLLSKGRTDEAMVLLPLEIKHRFIDCLSKQNFSFHVSGENNLRKRSVEFLKSLLGWHPASRRVLAEQPFQDLAPALTPTLGPTLAPTPAPAFAPDPPSTPSPSPGIESPSDSPAPSSVPSSTRGSASNDNFLAPAAESTNPSDYHDISADGIPILPPKKQDNSEKTAIIAVVVTALVAALLASLVCCCYFRHRGNKIKSQHDMQGDNPLFILNSSEKLFDYGNTTNNSKIGVLPLSNDPNQTSNQTSSSAIQSNKNPYSDELSGVSINASVPTPPPPPLPPPPGRKAAPPPKGSSPPLPPQLGKRVNKPPPLGPKKPGIGVSADEDGESGSAPKTKLKPFFWDKVQADADQSMVWDQIKAGSFQFNEEMIESLFGYAAAEKNKTEGKKRSSSIDTTPQFVRILDPKKSQNLAISLKAFNLKTEEVCDALMEGNELPAELLQTLLKLAPTTDEELKLRLYSGELALLGPAEQFLKTLVDIPFAFQRMDALLFMASLPEEVSTTKQSYATVEVACKELRNSRLFLKLLEAVLKTGNRMNDGTYRGHAHAFKLDTLLKLSDVRGTDGKTTLLHFVVQEIIRSEGARAVRLAKENGSISSLNSDDLVDDSHTESGERLRALGLKVVSGLSNELENVKKAAGLDTDTLTGTVANLGHKLLKIKEFLNTSMQSIEEESGFHQSLRSFVEHAETDITSLLEDEKRIRLLVKNTTDYFHGNTGKDEGLRLFVIVRDFLRVVDKACKDVAAASSKKVLKSKEGPTPSHARDPREATMSPARDPRQLLFPAIKDRRVDYSSSDDESP